MRRKQTEAKLKPAASHVTYEAYMLFEAARYIPGGLSSPADKTAENMGLESFLLHYRNLRVFLCPTLTKDIGKREIIASDFFGECQPRDLGDHAELGIDRKRINALLAHLSYDRNDFVARDEKEWDIDAMCDRMHRNLNRFIEPLSVEQRSWFRLEAGCAIDLQTVLTSFAERRRAQTGGQSTATMSEDTMTTVRPA